ncbi:FCD domain-containing protein [Agrobacterium vitis]|uniref:FCD domain-containing protein n=1 Tax=Agrobacterium vitis TaxID=373 RepID=A0AAE4X038_AGRVI|nr:FCD domain-containing protein [Agrobacterium vitis]MBF2714148.1 FCD domain-containing protein [Agrobacterium vitis]MUO81527.1 FCD domain-containing protein [Agrobacterium vitis]MUO95826.1 FCD domain-containing protein [Agrobacterium vitis]MVA93905.1 FCD domain-containing protein [Agrobacterium vitis]MVB03588.1 FCD domain-containing protein [Agrobacterium vitis]
MVNTSRIVQAYDTLKQSILNGSFRPRTRLRIEHLSEKFDVGPGAIREALSRLTSEGMVVAEPQRGFLVAPISKSDLQDLTTVRIEIEVKCLRRSIELGDVAWETQVLSANHLMARTPEYTDNGESHPDWAVVHTNFHDALVAACGSPWRLKLRGQLFLQAERYRRLSVPHARLERDVAGEHRMLAEATLARDADTAMKLVEEHFQKTADLLLASDAPFDD